MVPLRMQVMGCIVFHLFKINKKDFSQNATYNINL